RRDNCDRRKHEQRPAGEEPARGQREQGSVETGHPARAERGRLARRRRHVGARQAIERGVEALDRHPITTTTVTNGQLGQPTAVAAVRSCHGGGGATFVTMTGTVAPAFAAAARACCSSGSAVVAPGWMNVISAESLGDGSDGYASASVRSRLLPDVTLPVTANAAAGVPPPAAFQPCSSSPGADDSAPEPARNAAAPTRSTSRGSSELRMSSNRPALSNRRNCATKRGSTR